MSYTLHGYHHDDPVVTQDPRPPWAGIILFIGLCLLIASLK